MNRILSIASLVLLLALLHSCREELKSCSGHIKEQTDSTLVIVTGGADVTLDIMSTRYDNGLVMVGDSVNVHYVGDLRSKSVRAMLIRLVPRKGRVIDAVFDPSKELKVSETELTDEQRESVRKFEEAARKHGH